MSCNYDLHCANCDHAAGLDINHGGDQLTIILGEREALAKVAPLLRDGMLWYFNDTSGRLGIAAHFFAAHAGHTIEVRSEYGERYGACCERMECECGTSRYCVLDKGHEWPHQHQVQVNRAKLAKL